MQSGARLLVTGATGFLGLHVVARAAARHCRVCAQVHRAAAPAPWPQGVDPLAADFSSPAAVERLLEDARPELVLHGAALASPADCERDPPLAQRVNVDAARAIAAWCARRGARLVHVSTDLVFGAFAPPPGGFGEAAATGPLSAYGRTKVDAERAVLESGARVLVVRLPLLLGPSHGRGRGATESVLAAVDRGETPALFEDEFRTPLDVRSAAEALVELAGLDVSGVLHVAGPERLSRYEIGFRALRRRGLNAHEARAKLARTTRGAAGLAASRPADASLDSSRARSFLRTLLVGIESGST